jgi:glutathione synthase/RimK-type ligase-like ATP-grasp enzyme
VRFFILDERQVWHGPAIQAARRRGYLARRIFAGEESRGPGIGFIRPHADPGRLPQNRLDFQVMAERLTMIQDAAQVEVYENKSEQVRRWGSWMPETWRFTDSAKALAFAATVSLPIVSKADVGASSRNVWVFTDRVKLMEHVRTLFGPGIEVNHCSGGARSRQRGFVLLQRFIPHQVTWRVNAIGRARAIFKRYCYPDKPVAQTGNVEPVMALDAETESLLAYADAFFEAAGTRWCAIDILRDGDDWKLLETSLAWPWPSPGECNRAPLLRSEQGRVWGEVWDAMFDEIEAGAW